MLTITEISENFSLLEEWEERYRYLIELGQKLPHYPDLFKKSDFQVSGCVSRVWLFFNRIDHHIEKDDPILYLLGDSDAYIVKGLIYIITSLYSGKRISEIIKLNAEKKLAQLNLEENLTPQRTNGLRSIITRIQEEAMKKSV